MAMDMVSMEPSVLDQFKDGFLHLDKDLELLCLVLEELSSSLDWLLLFSKAVVLSLPLLKSED